MRATSRGMARWGLAVVLCAACLDGESAVAQRVQANASSAGPVRTVEEASTEAAVRPPADSTASDDAVATWFEDTVATARPAPRLLPRKHAVGSALDADRRPAGRVRGTGAIGLLWPLGLVLALIAAAAWGVRRWLARSRRVGSKGVVNVFARHYLSPKQSLCLVQLGRRVLLVGVTPDRISTVAEIQEPDEAAAILSAVERSRPGSFTSVFARFSEKDMEKEGVEAPIEHGAALAGGQLARTGASLRDLIGRIRAVSGEKRVSAEPT